MALQVENMDIEIILPYIIYNITTFQFPNEVGRKFEVSHWETNLCYCHPFL